MYLFQIFLPLYDNEGNRFTKQKFESIRQELLRKFGGVTFYQQGASGLWEDASGKIDSDTLIVIEVMTKTVKKKWWRKFKFSLEKKLKQDEILIRLMQSVKV